MVPVQKLSHDVESFLCRAVLKLPLCSAVHSLPSEIISSTNNNLLMRRRLDGSSSVNLPGKLLPITAGKSEWPSETVPFLSVRIPSSPAAPPTKPVPDQNSSPHSIMACCGVRRQLRQLVHDVSSNSEIPIFLAPALSSTVRPFSTSTRRPSRVGSAQISVPQEVTLRFFDLPKTSARNRKPDTPVSSVEVVGPLGTEQAPEITLSNTLS